MTTKTFAVQQTISVNVTYLVDAEDEFQATDCPFDPSRVIDIEPLDWDRPWDAEEADDEQKDTVFLTAAQLEPWACIGIPSA